MSNEALVTAPEAQPSAPEVAPEAVAETSPDTIQEPSVDTPSPAPAPEADNDSGNDVPKDPASVSAKLSLTTPLERVLNTASILENQRKIPSAEALKSHMSDFKKMFDERDSNPNFDADMKNMMEGSKHLLKALRKEANQIMSEGKPGGKDQVNELAQWVMDIARNFFGNKNGLSHNQADTIKGLENGMKIMGEELTDMSQKLEKHNEDLVLKQESANAPTPGMPK
jgi:hypothetical protein